MAFSFSGGSAGLRMRAVFYIGALGSLIFSLFAYNLVMPLYISLVEGIDAAYFVYTYKWIFHAFFILLIAFGSVAAFRTGRKLLPIGALLAAASAAVITNAYIPELIFREPTSLVFKTREGNKLDGAHNIIGVEHGGEAKAYPIWMLASHHQLRDVIGGKPVIVTYCPLCRTARVFEPIVHGLHTTFKLVALHESNSVYEDAATGSWWQQATGKAIAGPLKGETLPQLAPMRLTVQEWFELHPNGAVMQPDGKSSSRFPSAAQVRWLTTGSLKAWESESWVVAIELSGISKAYDWNHLKAERIVNDTIASRPIVLAVGLDQKSIAAFERPQASEPFSLKGDVLVSGATSYDFAGRDLASSRRLTRIDASREFWACRIGFYPDTQRWDVAGR